MMRNDDGADDDHPAPPADAGRSWVRELTVPNVDTLRSAATVLPPSAALLLSLNGMLLGSRITLGSSLSMYLEDKLEEEAKGSNDRSDEDCVGVGSTPTSSFGVKAKEPKSKAKDDVTLIRRWDNVRLADISKRPEDDLRG